MRCGDCWAAEGKRGDVILILMRRNDGEAEKKALESIIHDPSHELIN